MYHSFSLRWLVLYAAFFVALRILLELKSTGAFLNGLDAQDLFEIIQWMLWYAGTLLMTLSCFRYVAGASIKNSLMVLLATPVLLIPVAAAALDGRPLVLDYLHYSDPSMVRAVFSLMFFSSNHYLFYEFVVLMLGIPIVAYWYSRSVVRALVTFVGFYGALIVIQGFIHLPAGASKGEVLAYLAATSSAWLILFLWPELLLQYRFLKSMSNKQ